MISLSASLTVHEFRRADELRATAGDWDDLWGRAESASPLTRAELLAQWFDEFAPAANWRCLAVEQDGRLVAALPLVGRRVKRLLELGGVPSNPWCVCGDLLVDPQADVPSALDALAGAVNRLAWPLLWLAPIPLAAPRWQAFAAALTRAEMPFAAKVNYDIGEINIDGDWERYKDRWTGGHRRQMRKALDRACEDGPLEVKVYDRLASDQLDQALRRGFAIEHRSWKGPAGTSVLRAPGMFELYRRQARQLAEWGQLRLAFLEHAGREIAFEYGFRAKRTYFSAKVGYDPAFADYRPGQLLRLLLFQRFHDERDVTRVDFWGPLSQATSPWSDSVYPVGRMVVAPRRLAGRLSFQAFRLLRASAVASWSLAGRMGSR
ncbi:MAG TPA: GNAT family N-acetyltransferase [Pirellulales bacterium]|nr:GNAT family N-acetyltransferase [Pirellulales bacterium]